MRRERRGELVRPEREGEVWEWGERKRELGERERERGVSGERGE